MWSISITNRFFMCVTKVTVKFRLGQKDRNRVDGRIYLFKVLTDKIIINLHHKYIVTLWENHCYMIALICEIKL